MYNHGKDQSAERLTRAIVNEGEKEREREKEMKRIKRRIKCDVKNTSVTFKNYDFANS